MLKDDPPHSSMFQGLASSAGTPGDHSPLFIFTGRKKNGNFKTWQKEIFHNYFRLLQILIRIGSKKIYMVLRKIKN
jgi:hypothetical protein